jgi:hypothetical protein
MDDGRRCGKLRKSTWNLSQCHACCCGKKYAEAEIIPLSWYISTRYISTTFTSFILGVNAGGRGKSR